jgi:hypothetical protein
MTFDRMIDLALGALQGLSAAQKIVAFWGPLGSTSSWLAPLAAIGSVLVLALLTGIAVGSLATLLVTLLALLCVLSEVFGLSVELTVPA